MSDRQHFSTVTNKWGPCGAKKRTCRYPDHRNFAPAVVEAQFLNVPVLPSAITSVAAPVEDRKSFMSSLTAWFMSRKNSRTGVSSSVDSVVDVKDAVLAPNPVPVADSRVLGEVMRNDEGVIQVTAALPWDADNKVEVYDFGVHTSFEDAVRLHEADPRTLYQNGECGVLANELWNRNPHVEGFYILSEDPHDTVFGIHQFVKLSDGSYADSLGVWSEEQLIASWKKIDAGIVLQVYDDGEPIPDKDPNVEISNPELFDTISDVISKHFAGKNNRNLVP